jgi:hypothetical protein
VLSARRGFKGYPQREYNKLRSFEVVDRIVEMIQDYLKDGENEKEVAIKVDDTGTGSGVTDELIRRGYYAIAINNNQVAKDEDRYDSAITEMYYDFKDILPELDIPDDMLLRRELSTRQYDYDKKGRKMVESKDKYKKRYKKSPDKADSFLLCFYSYYVGSGIC